MRVENAPSSYDDLGAYLAQSSVGPGVFDADEGDDIELWGYFGWQWRGDAETWFVLELESRDVRVDATLAGYSLAYSLDALSSTLDGVSAVDGFPGMRLFDASPWVLTIQAIRDGMATLALGDGFDSTPPVWTCTTLCLLREVRAYLVWSLPFLDAAYALAPSRGLALHRLHFVTYLGWLDAALAVVEGDTPAA